MNPCPCGYLDHPRRSCTCSSRQVAAYAQRVSGPLRDRIDIFARVANVDPAAVLSPPSGRELDSQTLERRVAGAAESRKGLAGASAARTPRATVADLLRPDGIEPDAVDALRRLGDRVDLSARGFGRTLRLARTLADLRDRERVTAQDVLEALPLRIPEA